MQWRFFKRLLWGTENYHKICSFPIFCLLHYGCKTHFSAKWEWASVNYSLAFSQVKPFYFLGCLCSTNLSWEHRIRAHLLEDYDRKVRPIFRGKNQVIVQFALKISRLVNVVSMCYYRYHLSLATFITGWERHNRARKRFSFYFGREISLSKPLLPLSSGTCAGGSGKPENSVLVEYLHVRERSFDDCVESQTAAKSQLQFAHTRFRALVIVCSYDWLTWLIAQVLNKGPVFFIWRHADVKFSNHYHSLMWNELCFSNAALLNRTPRNNYWYWTLGSFRWDLQ